MLKRSVYLEIVGQAGPESQQQVVSAADRVDMQPLSKRRCAWSAGESTLAHTLRRGGVLGSTASAELQSREYSFHFSSSIQLSTTKALSKPKRHPSGQDKNTYAYLQPSLPQLGRWRWYSQPFVFLLLRLASHISPHLHNNHSSQLLAASEKGRSHRDHHHRVGALRHVDDVLEIPPSTMWTLNELQSEKGNLPKGQGTRTELWHRRSH